jgi:ribosome-binding factor A
MNDIDRTRRVNELLRREISEFIERNLSFELKCLATVNSVKVSPDLHDAQVYISFYGGNGNLHKNAMRKIVRNRSKIQAQINKNMKIRNTPKLDFRLDDSIAKGDKIIRLIEELGIEDTE